MEQEWAYAPYVVGTIIAVVTLSVSAYFIARFMKGSLKLVLRGRSFASGQPIAGTLTVHARKAIEVDRMFVALIGKRQRRRRGADGKRRTEWREFYRDESDIVIAERFPAGFRRTYPFAIDAPALPQLDASVVDNEFMKMMIGGANALARFSGGRMRWEVVSRLETRGVDLATSRRIHVSMKQA